MTTQQKKSDFFNKEITFSISNFLTIGLPTIISIFSAIYFVLDLKSDISEIKQEVTTINNIDKEIYRQKNHIEIIEKELNTIQSVLYSKP